MLAFSLKNVMYTHTWYIYNTCLFLKKLYKYTYICIRYGTGLGRPCPRVPSRPEEKFCPVPMCPVPKIFGTKISRPKMSWDWMGRPGRDGTGKFEHPYFH